MTIIGIDFSINSTAVSILNCDDLHVFSFVPNLQKGKAAYKIHENLEPEIKLVSYDKLEYTKNSIEDQKIKLKNAESLVEQIINQISSFSPIEIRIEGFSYASKGNSFIDLIVFNTYLKVKLIDKYGHIISVIPPKTLKKSYTGNGNATKCDMLRKFINEEIELSKKISQLNIVKEEEFKIQKPIDDIVDAFALCKISY